MEKVYFAEEKIVGAFGLTQDSQTTLEERQVMKDVIEDGVSVIAIDKNNNNKVIGACLNKIHVTTPQKLVGNKSILFIPGKTRIWRGNILRKNRKEQQSLGDKIHHRI
jgi:hypothetical protein